VARIAESGAVAVRVETIGNATLYLGDCLEVLRGLRDGCQNGDVSVEQGRGADIALPTRTFDCVITSPPYNTLAPSVKPSGLHAERKTGRNQWMDKQGGYFDQRDEAEYQAWQQIVLEACLEVASLVWINHKTRYRDGFGIHPLTFYKAPLFAEVVWDRGISMALNCGRYAPSHEYWFGFGKPRFWDDSLNSKMSVWRVPPGIEKSKDNDHPCPYPPRLVEPLIQSSTRAGGVVVDPFMGSGSTGVACSRLERKFIGIEIEPRYFDIACERIENAQRQERLFA
jgi:site-specific DNA-methyltransferase (adenine-specific)